jgi:hypothetical protein
LLASRLWKEKRKKYAKNCTAFAESLLDLPASLQTLDVSGLIAEVLHDSLPAPVLFADGNDLLSTNLRYISVHLRQLHLHDVPLANDFLCPLGDDGKPLPGEQIEWPNLTEIHISRPEFLPSGMLIAPRKPFAFLLTPSLLSSFDTETGEQEC